MTDICPSNFKLLKQTFGNIIQNTKEVDQSGKESNSICQRITFYFIDRSFLSITEYTKDHKIDYYHYDWYSKDKTTILMKFHSEPHSDKNYQTKTEPFHIHIKGLLDDERLPNYNFRELVIILEFIQFFLLLNEQQTYENSKKVK